MDVDMVEDEQEQQDVDMEVDEEEGKGETARAAAWTVPLLNYHNSQAAVFLAS